MENSIEIPQKTKYTATINPSPGHIFRHSYNSKRSIHPYAHCSTIHNSQDIETTNVHQEMNGLRRCGTYTQWNTTQP